MTDAQSESSTPEAARWQPLSSRQRRVAGVLVEKAKTTPDAYPLTLNALMTGCNQKSNRNPQMNLTSEDVLETVEQLRGMGAVAEVQSGGRVPKFRHLLYEWLGVDKVQLAVIAELLLRGQQTVGELRSRAARMEPIADVSALRPVLHCLAEKRLVVFLTAEGRGQMVTHGLHTAREAESLQTQAAEADPSVGAPPPAAASPPAASSAGSQELELLRRDVEQLRGEFERLRAEVHQLRNAPGEGVTG